MATIIGEEINPLLQKQINVRQSTHGSGVISLRTHDELVALSANNSWVKLASGISISSGRLIKSKLSSYSEGMDLAKRNVLFGGTARYSGGTTIQKKVLPDPTPEQQEANKLAIELANMQAKELSRRNKLTEQFAPEREELLKSQLQAVRSRILRLVLFIRIQPQGLIF